MAGSDGAEARNRLWMTDDLATAVKERAIVVVGCGGTGALVATGLAHLGVRRLTFCDPDRLETSNLNRMPAARPVDVGRFKVDIVHDYLLDRFSGLEIGIITSPSPNDQAAAACACAAAVFGCLDTVPARLELDLLCRIHRRLLIDVGTGFARDGNGDIVNAGGQVLISRPSGPCLQCLGFTATARERGYILQGNAAPQASSLMLNSVVSAIATQALVDEWHDNRPDNRIDYDATARTLTSELVVGRRDCPVCGVDAYANLEALRPADPYAELPKDERCRTKSL